MAQSQMQAMARFAATHALLASVVGAMFVALVVGTCCFYCTKKARPVRRARTVGVGSEMVNPARTSTAPITFDMQLNDAALAAKSSEGGRV